MAYYLGREVVVALTTEDVGFGVDVNCLAGGSMGDIATYAVADGPSAATDVSFAGPRVHNNIINSPSTAWSSADRTVFGTQGATREYSNEVVDVTSVDIGIGVSDEDITYFGQRTTLKTEIKKETTISITRKKSNACWDTVFNEARHGVESTGAFFGYGSVGHVNPGRNDYGYRVFLKLKSDGEVIALPNCCITGHTISLNADGTSEETLELMCYLTPIISVGTANVEDETLTDHQTVF